MKFSKYTLPQGLKETINKTSNYRPCPTEKCNNPVGNGDLWGYILFYVVFCSAATFTTPTHFDPLTIFQNSMIIYFDDYRTLKGVIP